MNRNGARRRGFSLAELLVVLGILGILIAILLPYIEKVRETSRRVQCADNLSQIMIALRSYAAVNGHFYPSTIFDKAHPGYTAYTGADSPDPFAKETRVSPNDVTASLWLLIRGGYIPARDFICPSTSDYVDPMRTNDAAVGADKRSNFTSANNLSYSYASPFSTALDSRGKIYKLNDTFESDFALVADKNPGVSSPPPYNASPFEIATANSRNHHSAGQNVLYADGHVQFQSTPYCGTGVADLRDNIYTVSDPTPQKGDPRHPPEVPGWAGRQYSPASEKDSYLVPTDDDAAPGN